jgi:hypothetical protein
MYTTCLSWIFDKRVVTLVTDGMYLVDRFNYIVSIATAPKLYPEGNLFIRLEFQLDVISFSFFFFGAVAIIKTRGHCSMVIKEDLVKGHLSLWQWYNYKHPPAASRLRLQMSDADGKESFFMFLITCNLG